MDFFNLFLVLNILCAVFGEVLDIGQGVDFGDDGVFEDLPNGLNDDHGINGVLGSTVSRTVKRYFCSVEVLAKDGLESETNVPLVYGANAWKFPAQDVNLRLKYPLENLQTTDPGYALITSVEVILHFDGKESQGFIVDGGMMQDHIVLSFVMKNITQLWYRFWLHGMSVPKNSQVINQTHFCSPGNSVLGVDFY